MSKIKIKTKTKTKTKTSKNKNKNVSNQFTARIVLGNNTGGIAVDKDTIKEVLESMGGIVEVVINDDFKYKLKGSTLLFKKVDIQIFIEHVYLEDLPAERSYIFVNQEYITDWDMSLIKSKNIIPLCKTHEGLKTLHKLGIAKAKYVGFGNNRKNEYSDSITKCPNLFIHIVGKSPMKGTKTLIDTWIRKKITYPLVITASNIFNGNTKLFNYWKSLNPNLSVLPDSIMNKWEEWKQMTKSVAILPQFQTIDSCSIYFCNTELDYNIIQFFQSVAEVHMCPSLIEGWGQYIDEGRRAKAVVLTLDASPMNELITDKNNKTDLSTGILVKATRGPSMKQLLPPGWTQYFIKNHDYTKFLYITYKTTINDLYNGVTRILKMSPEQKRELGNNALKQSQHDYTNFKTKFTNLILEQIK